MPTTDRDTAAEGVSAWDVESAPGEERSLYQDLADAQTGGAYRLRVRPARPPTKSWRSAGDAAYSFDFVSDRFSEILGITRTALQRNPGIVPDLVLGEDRPDFRARTVQALATRTPFQWIGRMTVRGETRWIRFETRSRVLANGDVLRTGRVEDVTEWKEGVKALRVANDGLRRRESLLNETGRMARVGGWELDLATNRLMWTEEMRHLHEVPSEFVPTLEKASRFYHPEDQPKIAEVFRRAIECAEPFDVQLRIITALGCEVWVQAIGKVHLSGGAAIRIAGIFQDITERRRAEERIQALNVDLESQVVTRTAELAAAIREMEVFSYSVAHDLRAPIRAIDGFSAKLDRGYGEALDDEGKRLLGTVRSNSRMMGRLIDDLLEFSRAGRTALKKGPVDMARLVQGVLVELPSASAAVPAEVRVVRLLPATGDPVLLHEVWLNLVANAIKFSSLRPHPVVEIGSRPGTDGPEYYVKDNGVGFDPRFSDKLFGVFQRLHGVQEFEGTGIGLALVKRIVERHGGRVFAEGAVGKGATFSFSLPAKHGQEESSP